MSLTVLPLAITMNADRRHVGDHLRHRLQAAEALGLLYRRGDRRHRGRHGYYTLASVLGNSVSLGDPSDSGSLGNIIQYLLVGLLIILSIKSYVGRETSEPPRWLGALQNAKPRTAFTTGCCCSRCSLRPRHSCDRRNKPRAAKRPALALYLSSRQPSL